MSVTEFTIWKDLTDDSASWKLGPIPHYMPSSYATSTTLKLYHVTKETNAEEVKWNSTF